MKLDEQCHSNIGFKCDSRPHSFLADSKPFEKKEKPLDSTGLIADGIVKENQNGVMHEIKSNYEDLDPSVYLENARDEWLASKLNHSTSVNEFANSVEKVVRNVMTSNSHSSKNMNLFEDKVFYLDRNVMECELPEVVVCYKESTYHIVKDICIDEGIPTHDRFLFESGLDEGSDLFFPSSKKDRDSTLMEEKLDIDMYMRDVSMEGPKENQFGKNIDDDFGSNKKLDLDATVQDVSSFLEENDCKKGIPNQHDSKDLALTRKIKDEADGVQLFTLGELLSMAKLSIVNFEAMSSDYRSGGIKLKSFQNPSEVEVMETPSLLSAVEEPNSSSGEAVLSAPVYISAAEESDHGKGEATQISPALASTSEESTSNSLVNMVSNSSKLTSSKDECRNCLHHQSLETGSTPKLEDTAEDTPKLEDTADQPFSNNLQHGNGECSFSASEGPVTGLITYSGPILHSGSLSLRSDSSTTSTRSFAFPILQSEWNSSPERMAKPDRRHYRKHRGWKRGLLCCRF